jgi:hypothetical protein
MLQEMPPPQVPGQLPPQPEGLKKPATEPVPGQLLEGE